MLSAVPDENHLLLLWCTCTDSPNYLAGCVLQTLCVTLHGQLHCAAGCTEKDLTVIHTLPLLTLCYSSGAVVAATKVVLRAAFDSALQYSCLRFIANVVQASLIPLPQSHANAGMLTAG